MKRRYEFIGEALVAGLLRQRLDGRVVEAEIEHRIHHARHRRAGTRAHRDQQRIGAVAKGLAGDAAHIGERRLHLLTQVLGVGLAVLVIVGADLGGDGEARRNGQAETCHLGKAGAFAAEEVAHIGAALGLAVAEAVDPFAFPCRRLGRGRPAARRAVAAGCRAPGLSLHSSTTRRRSHHGTMTECASR